MKNIAVVSVARSDYGILRPVLNAVLDHPELNLQLIVSGTHLEKSHGLTIREIEVDGFPVAAKIPLPYMDDNPVDTAACMGAAITGFAQAYHALQPDIIILLGDRYEMFAAASAAVPLTIPMAHIHGGELTEGAIDDVFRHATTKMAHLHFPATDEYARNIRLLGEEPWRICTSGAPALDNLQLVPLLSPRELQERTGLDFTQPTLLATFHPVTLDTEDEHSQVKAFLEALVQSGLPALITMPNADPGNQSFRQAIEATAHQTPQLKTIEHLGTQAYFSCMKYAAAMVGNSSSGIIEAASFQLPVVNIGRRQQGRTAGPNVVHCPNTVPTILAAIQQVTAPDFQAQLTNIVNPYGNGHAARVIINKLLEMPARPVLLNKIFYREPSTR